MSSLPNPRRTAQGLAAVAIISLASACGGSDEASPGEDVSNVPASEAAEQAADDDVVDPLDDRPATDSEPEAAPPAASVGQGVATLSLATGELVEFSVRCALETQEVAGSVILFTASSTEAPFLDITQFASEGVVTDVASISVYDAEYNTLWEATTFFDAFGGSIELSLDGSTINGSGTFFPGGDIEQTPVDGTIVANC